MISSGIFGLLEVLVEIWVFTFLKFEDKFEVHVGKILGMLNQNSQSYGRFNGASIYGILTEFATYSATNS